MTLRRVLLFGELLLRLTTPRHERFVQAQEFEISYTGGEANAGVLLAGFGAQAELISAVPNSELGQACLNYMRRFGLDVTHVARRGQRLGILYVELGAGPRSSKVIYDRAGSSFSALKVSDVPWDDILRDADWLHFTGTAPALSADLAALTLEGCQAARKQGTKVSCDLNYRSTLWPVEDARRTMSQLAHHIDVLIANVDHASLLLGAPPANSPQPNTAYEPQAYHTSTTWLREHYGFTQVALTVRGGAAAEAVKLAGVLDDGQHLYGSRMHTTHVVDRIGAGDAFAAGVIHGLLDGWSADRTIEFAAALACLKHTMHDDFCHLSLAEALAYAEHGGDGRVIR